MMDNIRIALLGSASQRMHINWAIEDVAELKKLGFTCVQLNIAWAYRPADEPLNLEDVWPVLGAPESRAVAARFQERQKELRHRAQISHEVGLRTLFHFGAPFQGAHEFLDDVNLPQCILDPATIARYVQALIGFGKENPHIDDLLIYTYDQDAWLCSEFGNCDRCAGVPLHERLPQFLNALGKAWVGIRAGARVWWEPWELSSGQTLSCILNLDPDSLGLMLHSNIAEVISTMPADRFFRHVSEIAASRGIPVIGEVFLSSNNEEVEPWSRLPVPLVTLNQIRAIESVHGVVGIKEYFGIVSSPFDINLAAANLYFNSPSSTNDEILATLAKDFDLPWLAQFWASCSKAYELYPWDTSWFCRQLGRSLPRHELTAATIRGMQSNHDQWDTPAWQSSRGAVFMRVTNSEPNPWLLEDVSLQFLVASRVMAEAIEIFDKNFLDKGDISSRELMRQASEAIGFITRTTAYVCHIRETLICRTLRNSKARSSQLIAELAEVLETDRHNQIRENQRCLDYKKLDPDQIPPTAIQIATGWVVDRSNSTEEIEEAISLLKADSEAFLARYFQVVADNAPAGQFSLTSR